MKRNAKTRKGLRRIDLTIYVNGESGPVERGTTAWVDKRYPGLAIHDAYELPVKDWRVTHIASGMVVATLPTEDAARAALEPLSKLADWTQPKEAVIPADPHEWRYLKVCINSVVTHVTDRINHRRTALPA